MSITVGVYEAKTQFTKLLQAVEAGERVTITRHGKPVAELSVPRSNAVRAREAFAKIDEIRADMRRRGVPPVTPEEVREWINEGRM